MDTNHVGDIAEQAVILRCLQFGWGVSRPIGNRHPYDLIVDIDSRLVKVQVKSAWFDKASSNFIVDNRRTKSNRRQMLRENYQTGDFEFAIIYLPAPQVFYVMPFDVFVGFGSSIAFVEDEKRQRKPKSAAYRENWNLIGKTEVPGS